MSTKQHVPGTQVVFFKLPGSVTDDTTIGRIYTLDIDPDGDEYFVDDKGEDNYLAASGSADGLPGIGEGMYVVIVD